MCKERNSSARIRRNGASSVPKEVLPKEVHVEYLTAIKLPANMRRSTNEYIQEKPLSELGNEVILLPSRETPSSSEARK
jgi:hypothetical protein